MRTLMFLRSVFLLLFHRWPSPLADFLDYHRTVFPVSRMNKLRFLFLLFFPPFPPDEPLFSLMWFLLFFLFIFVGFNYAALPKLGSLCGSLFRILVLISPPSFSGIFQFLLSFSFCADGIVK